MDIRCPSCGFNNIEGEDHCQQCFHSLMQMDIPHVEWNESESDILRRPVSDLLTGRDLLVCDPEDTIETVLQIFQKEKKGCVLVYDKKKMLGILSNRDLLLRVAGTYSDLSKVTVGEVMTQNPGFVRPEDPIAFAINKMSVGGYRHVPVLRQDGTPVSILLIKDVLDYLAASKKSY